MSDKLISVFISIGAIMIVSGALLKLFKNPIGELIEIFGFAMGGVFSAILITKLKKMNAELEDKLKKVSKINANEI